MGVQTFMLLILLIIAVVADNKFAHNFDFSLSEYPTSIPHFPVRADPKHPSRPLKRGAFRHEWGHMPTYESDKEDAKIPQKKKITYERFQELMQCSRDEPGLNQHGSFSLLAMLQPTRDILEVLCAHAERECDDGDWRKCQKKIPEFKEGHYRKEAGFPVGSFRGYTLIRIMNASIYMDWPWGRERIYDPTTRDTISAHYQLLMMTLDMLQPSAVKDSVFFYGAELPGLHKWNHPFPNVAFNPTRLHNMIPWPWYTEFWYTYRLYLKLFQDFPHSKEISDEMIDKHLFTKKWEDRKDKAALFATYANCRQILFEQQRVYPDLVEMSFGLGGENIIPWNPLSPEINRITGFDETFTKEDAKIAFMQDPIGYAKPLMAMNDGKRYNSGDYKYVVVPVAMDGTGSSGRLLWLLSYSGAVVLLQEGIPTYHITSRLVPWVHYVPLSYSGADLAEKVAWLREHDEMARRIAENGRNFGKSYLRLEDYYCYAARLLTSLGEVLKNSTALKPYDPVLISNKKPVGLEFED